MKQIHDNLNGFTQAFLNEVLILQRIGQQVIRHTARAQVSAFHTRVGPIHFRIDLGEVKRSITVGIGIGWVQASDGEWLGLGGGGFLWDLKGFPPEGIQT